VGRPLGNPLNRLGIGLRGRRQGRLRGHLAGRLLNRLQGSLRNHPDDDLQDDLVGNPWDELGDRGASLGSRDGSRAGACVVLKAIGRCMALASAGFLARPLGWASSGLSTCSRPRSSVRFARGAVPSSLDSLPDRSLALLLDVAGTGVLVCS
jgi:hypothetical protein